MNQNEQEKGVFGLNATGLPQKLRRHKTKWDGNVVKIVVSHA
jgi:hypothetical protein